MKRANTMSTITVELTIKVKPNSLLPMQKRPMDSSHHTCRKFSQNHFKVVLLGRPIFARLLFVTFEDQKGPFFVILFCSNFHSLEASRPASKLASKPAPRCFVLISMVSRRWSSRLALRPASNFVSSVSSYSFCFAAILHTLRPRGLP